MIARYFDGVVPQAEAGTRERAIRDLAQQTIDGFGQHFEALDFSAALNQVWVFIRALDGYLTATTPWVLGSKNDVESRAQLAAILYTAAESIRIVTALVNPVLPDSAARIWRQLGLGGISEFDLRTLAWGQLKPGTKLGELSAVFPRAEKDMIQRMQDLEQNNNGATTPDANLKAKPDAIPGGQKDPQPQQPVANASPEGRPTAAQAAGRESAHPDPAEAAPAAATSRSPASSQPHAETPAPPAQITIDDFAKIDLRVAQIKVAEHIPKSDKLLRLEVDLGYETRQIVAGIAEAYSPESLIGRKVVIVANLAPRKLRGLESNGMIVAASIGEKGKPVLAGFLEEIEIGARLK